MSSLIVSQALPLTVAQLVQVIYNVVDRVYIGHMPGQAEGAALTGVGVCFPIITLVAAFVNLFATGGAPLCAMARGRRDEERALLLEGNTLSMQVLTGLAVMVLVYLFKRPLLYALGASDATYGFANDYLSVYLIGTVFVMVGTGMTGFINLQGFPRYGMAVTMSGAILNLVLDPLFIFGLHMGVRGAAIASVISQALSAFLVLRFLFGKRAVLKLTRRHLMNLRPGLIKEIVTLGIAGFIQQATNCAVQAVCNMTLSVWGGDIYIGVMTILNSVRDMISLPIHGITGGSQPVLSYNYGARLPERVKAGIRFASVAGFVYTAVAWILILVFPHGFLSIFSSDQAIVDAGRLPILIYFAGFIFMTMQFAGQCTFVALGKAKQAVFFSLLRKAVIVIPLTLLLPRIGGLGVLGVFLAEPISNLLGGGACFLTMYLTVYRVLSAENEKNIENKKSDNVRSLL